MSLEFKRLSDVNIVEEISDNGHILIEDEGEIKKVPKAKVGSAVPTAIIESEFYIEYLYYFSSSDVPFKIEESEIQPMVQEIEETFVCNNMTFDEAWEILMNGGGLNAMLRLVDNDMMALTTEPCKILITDYRRIALQPLNKSGTFYIWSDEGIQLSILE